jgi:poly-gamma-glutamate synthesis protein (capsule biosynthesis protein)
MQIIIGGDLVPTQSNTREFINGDLLALIGKECGELLKNSDFNIFNLECPLCNVSQPIKKCGSNLRAPTETVKAIADLPASIVGLANNHILDQGWQGLEETMDVLRANYIAFVGAGSGL